MKNLLIKEFKLSTMMLTYIFLAFTLMTFLPGYPILCGAFFMCLGIFQSYQMCRESNDIMYSVMLPVSKRDIVKAKYAAAIILQMAAFVLCAVFTVIRMTVMSDSEVYIQNVMMPANPVYLAFVLMIFMVFNVIFIGGFFKTAYNIGRPFVIFIVLNFIVIGIGETLHHLPGFEVIGYANGSVPAIQYVVLALGAALYAAVTLWSCRVSQKRFENIDL